MESLVVRIVGAGPAGIGMSMGKAARYAPLLDLTAQARPKSTHKETPR
jgi:thioredoxin reductase